MIKRINCFEGNNQRKNKCPNILKENNVIIKQFKK